MAEYQHKTTFNPNPLPQSKTQEYRRKKAREWARLNRAKTKVWAQKWYNANKQHAVDQAKISNKRCWKRDIDLDLIPTHQWCAAKARAKKKQQAFTISRKDFIVPKYCPVLGIPLDRRNKDHSPSLDRIDNSVGYVPGNVEIISNKANSAKRNLTLAELQLMARYYGRLCA